MSDKGYSTTTLWGIHGGKTGDADSIFLKKNQIALGCDEVGNLYNLKSDNKKKKQQIKALNSSS